MQKRKLGKNNLEVPAIGLGCMGLSKQEIIEILIHIAFYAGVPTAVNAFQLAKEVFAEEKI